MRKLLPRSASTKSGVDEEENDEAGALDVNSHAGETGGETGGDTIVEGNTDGPGDLQQEEPTPSTAKSDNQTIMRFLGDREKVGCLAICIEVCNSRFSFTNIFG